MKATIAWKGDALFEAKTDSGHTLTIDGPPDQGGKNQGPRPMETMLVGLGACTSFDVMMILRRSRQVVSDCVATVKAKRADEIPAVFTDIHIHFEIKGTDVSPKQVERAIKMSADKYCSASIMLERGGVKITHDYTIAES
ncbi:OsmC family protein [Allohahella marinimesophila]|uniref:OsmC family protein n=1 Tax=Allohahella marinimesophila TaxID=1054972 RepID=A0ABP7PI56_9GAMM